MSDTLTQILLKLATLKKPVPSGSARSTIRKHWKPTAVFTGHWNTRHGKEVPESELLLGELSATIHQVGCYTVRNAVRVYKVSDPGYCPELEVPATPEEMEMVRKEFDKMKEMQDADRKMGTSSAHPWLLQNWRDKLRVTHEISARHKADTKGSFTYITRAAQARNFQWSESISHICTAKDHLLIADKHASLFVCNTYIGDSFSSETWYRLSPTGGITTLQLHPYDSKQEKARFQ